MSKLSKLRIIKLIIFISLLFWFALLLSQKIDLATADLGRHIKNGEIILNGTLIEKKSVLYTNHYSYTMPERGFVNHHWLSGVVFYVIEKIGGFGLLSFFYVLLISASFVLFFDAGRRKSNFWISILVSVAVLSLIIKRAEVRPEAFTYFFTALFYWILAVKKKYFWALPVVMLFWVNLHIGFVFGFFVLAVFVAGEWIKHLRKKANNFVPIIIIALLTFLVSLINPAFIKGVLYPLNIFQNYGYLIVENQSIGFLENIGFVNNQGFFHFKFIVFVLAVLIVAVAFKNWRKLDFAIIVLSLLTGVLAYMGIRHFPSFALFAIPAISYHAHLLLKDRTDETLRVFFWTGGVALMGFFFILQVQRFSAMAQGRGIGLIPGINKASEFYKENKIKGRIFNNYDIGGYLIYHLYPEKVFVDNRPEAYTANFFREEYIKPQEDAEKFRELDNKYKFNVIFFSHRDYTPWGQKFLIARAQDDAWVPIYADNFNIIFVKDIDENNDLIKKFRIPRENFSVRGNQ